MVVLNDKISSKNDVWLEKPVYDRAERLHYERLAKQHKQVKPDNRTNEVNDLSNNEFTDSTFGTSGSLAKEVAKARQQIKQHLQSVNSGAVCVKDSSKSHNLESRLVSLEKENRDIKKTVEDLRKLVSELSIQLKRVEERLPYVAICPPKPEPESAQSKNNDDDDGVDLFGTDSENEDAEKERIKEERLAAYAAKKSKKPTVVAKSNIILDIKPWDDTTNMKDMEVEVRKITMDGLLWGASKLVPLVFGIHKLQISCVVEDEKVSVDGLTEQIEEIEDYVQSVDIAAFNKI